MTEVDERSTPKGRNAGRQRMGRKCDLSAVARRAQAEAYCAERQLWRITLR